MQYAAYKLASGNWDAIKEEFADRCIAEIARYAPNVPGSIVHRQVLSPLDLERIYGLTGGNIFQGAMPLHQLFNMRPVPGYSDYRTPIDGPLPVRQRGPSRRRRDRSLRPQRRQRDAARRPLVRRPSTSRPLWSSF